MTPDKPTHLVIMRAADADPEGRDRNSSRSGDDDGDHGAQSRAMSDALTTVGVWE